jgi:hypothetical protein
MANSKSNIYPIQLQGAELNLNKYDAEIKQYSGFNKNNSPFVGGCLSNIFTKEEQIEGGNADNIYVDTNGDVYSVDDYGFLKNGTPIGFRSDTPLEFWGKQEYQMPEDGDIVSYYSDDAYAVKYLDENGYQHIVLHLGGKTKNVLLKDVNNNRESFFENVIIEKFYDETVGDFYCAAIKSYYRYGAVNRLGQHIQASVYSQFGDNEIVEALTKLPTFYLSFFLTFSDSCLYYEDGLVLFALNDCQNKILEQDNNDGIDFSVLADKNYVNIMSFVDYDGNKRLEGLYEGGIETKGGNLLAGFPNDKRLGYFFFRKGKMFLIFVPTTGQQTLWCRWDYKIDRSGNDAYVTVFGTHDESKDALGSSPTNYYMVQANYYNYILKRYGVSYCLYAKSVQLGKSTVTALCDFISFGASYNSENNMVNFAAGGVVNNSVLTNNGFASGIALPGADILATEWNSVDKDYIYFSEHFGGSEIEDNFVIYKDINNDKWYKIFRTTDKKVWFINNQIISNYNNKYNAYDIRRNKKLIYAYAWNNRFPFGRNYIEINNSAVPNNNYYFASCYNEYNQKDNSAAIFNPVPIIASSGIYVQFREIEDNSNGINFYINAISTGKILYTFTLKSLKRIGDNFINRNLKGLPFPIDTNGNIQLNPSLFAEYFSTFGNDVFIKENDNTYQLSKSDNQIILSYYFGTLVEGLREVFILQGQYYGIVNNMIFSIQFVNGVVAGMSAVVSVENLQFVGNTPYEALFFSKTNRCLYSFTGANVLSSRQLVDKISEVRNYLYNPATQTVFLITDVGIFFYGLFGQFLLEYTDISRMFLLDNGIVLLDNNGNYRSIKYYLDSGDLDYTKERIKLETCFYGMNNQTVTINDCLYFRLFSEEHEEGELKVSATTLSLKGRKTEETTFRIKTRDWDKITHTIYLRYQPKEQRGLGVSFSIDSPFKIAAISVGSQADSILVDKVSKGAINAPQQTSNNVEW